MTFDRGFTDRIKAYRHHPALMVREMFKVEPDAWQEEALAAFPHTPRMAMKACAGPGKSAVLAWLGWNFLLTRPYPIIGVTSTSADNLKANLWTELARWRDKAPYLQQKFEMTKTEIFCRDHPKTWKLEARTWAKDANAEQIGKALAGLHGEYVMWLLDETGDYPDAIMPTAEAIFAGNPKEAHIVQAGNPLMRSGPLFRACNIARGLWKVIEITADPDDPKRTPRVSVEYAKEQIRQYGRDNPWVLVKIFGQFPPSNINALIGDEDVKASMLRKYTEYDIQAASRVLGVDVARFGDDASVIFRRQGLQCFLSQTLRNVDSVQGAGRVARIWQEWQADGCFIDVTGGYGAGWYDQLLVLGRAPIGVQFAGQAHDNSRYYNKRAEMYFDAVAWIKRGGALPLPEGMAPEASELFQVLTQITYTFKGDRFLLEDKSQFKERTGVSPDETDAFVETFAEPVTPKPKGPVRARHSAVSDYNPFASMSQIVQDSYNPYGGMS